MGDSGTRMAGAVSKDCDLVLVVTEILVLLPWGTPTAVLSVTEVILYVLFMRVVKYAKASENADDLRYHKNMKPL